MTMTITSVVTRLDNVLYGADEMCQADNDDLVAEVNDLENIDSFHSVGIGRFKLTEVGLMCVDGQQRLTTTSLLVAAIVYRFCRRQKLSETRSDTTEATGTEATSTVHQQLLRGPSADLESGRGRSSTPLHGHAHLMPLSRPLGLDCQESLSSVTHYFTQDRQRTLRQQ